MTHSSLSRAGFAAALLGFLLAPALATAQVVLDDFSTDKFATDYVQKTVAGFGSGGWNLVSDELHLNTTDPGGYAAFVWKSHALENVGDWMSIDLAVANVSNSHNGGFSLWTSNTTTFDRVLEPRVTFNGTNHQFLASDGGGVNVWDEVLGGGIASGFMTMKVELTSHEGGDSVFTATLSFISGSSMTKEYTLAGYTGPIYLGPSAYLANGNNVAFDNLTYYSASAVPEPTTYAAIFGAAALALAGWRRRQRSASAATAN